MDVSITSDTLLEQLEEFYPDVQGGITLANNYIDMTGPLAEVEVMLTGWLVICLKKMFM